MECEHTVNGETVRKVCSTSLRAENLSMTGTRCFPQILPYASFQPPGTYACFFVINYFWSIDQPPIDEQYYPGYIRFGYCNRYRSRHQNVSAERSKNVAQQFSQSCRSADLACRRHSTHPGHEECKLED